MQRTSSLEEAAHETDSQGGGGSNGELGWVGCRQACRGQQPTSRRSLVERLRPWRPSRLQPSCPPQPRPTRGCSCRAGDRRAGACTGRCHTHAHAGKGISAARIALLYGLWRTRVVGALLFEPLLSCTGLASCPPPSQPWPCPHPAGPSPRPTCRPRRRCATGQQWTWVLWLTRWRSLRLKTSSPCASWAAAGELYVDACGCGVGMGMGKNIAPEDIQPVRFLCSHG